MRVNEIFGPTIQGEGKSLGSRVMFLRLAVCNLACSWCDTPYTWNWLETPFQHPEKYDRDKEIHEMTCNEILAELIQKGPEVKKLVISGGEPMLQQIELATLVKILKKCGYWTEIETNGTIEPSDEFLELIDQINCSPKTSNSGTDNSLKMRERPETLKKLVSSYKTFFKFVVRSKDDLPEIKDLVSRYNIDKERVYLMPECKSKKDHMKIDFHVQEYAYQTGFKFTPRLHLIYWDRERGR
jgi:7-cyano-7-deazaguanosine (preQ0) biosynthesis protein QueE